MDFKIKRGDTSPSIKLKLTPGVNLTGATVVFNVDGQAVTDINISRAAAKAEFEVTYSDGTIETFPREDFINVRVINDLG